MDLTNNEKLKIDKLTLGVKTILGEETSLTLVKTRYRRVETGW